MRAYVFTDTSLASEAGRFVWLEMNTEKAANASFRKRYAIQALPTYFIVSPDSETVLLRRVGGASTRQLMNILVAGHRAMSSGRLLPADSLALDADRWYGTGDYRRAVPAYEKALAEATPDWPGYERTVEALLFALSMSDENEKAARLALEALPRLGDSPAVANLSGSGLDAALALPAENPAREELIASLEAAATAVVSGSPPHTAADDISGVYITLLGARKDAGDEAGAREVALRWSAFLDEAAGAAPNPEARMVFDSHRLSAYVEIGQPGKAVPMLEASERDLPDDYNPPARLAVAYKAMKRFDDALAASGRALKKAYGPRQLLILQTRSDIQAASGDTASAVATLRDALAVAEALPDGQRSARTVDGLRKKIEAFGKRP